MSKRQFTTHRTLESTRHPVHELILPNGLRFLIWEDHSAPVIAYQTWFQVGSGDEKPGKTGIAHLFEHLMFKETKNRKEGEFDRLLEANGVYTNAATWLDWTYYQEKLPAEKLDLVMELEADRMGYMILNQRQLETEREVVMNERRLRVDNDPEGRAMEQLYHKHFGTHPYGHPTLGWMEDIKAITLDDCLNFYRYFYAPGNATVVAVGAVEVGAMMDRADRFYGHLPEVEIPGRVVEATYPPEEASTVFLQAPVQTQRLLALHLAPSLGEPGYAACAMANEILFNSESARIRSRLVEEEELASDVGGWYAGVRMGGAFEIQATLGHDGSWEAVLETIDEEIRTLVQEGIRARELEMAFNRLEMGFQRSLRSVDLRAQALGHYASTAGDVGAYFKVLDSLRNVTERDIVAVVRRVFDPSCRTVVTQVPE